MNIHGSIAHTTGTGAHAKARLPDGNSPTGQRVGVTSVGTHFQCGNDYFTAPSTYAVTAGLS